MGADILPLHLPGGLEVVVAVAEADETVAFALLRALVSDDARFLNGRVFRERLEQRVVRNLASEITHEKAEMGRIPLEQRGVRPGVTAAGADDGLLLCRTLTITRGRSPGSRRTARRGGRVMRSGARDGTRVGARRGRRSIAFPFGCRRVRVLAHVGTLPLCDLRLRLGIVVRVIPPVALPAHPIRIRILSRGREGVLDLRDRRLPIRIVTILRLAVICRARLVGLLRRRVARPVAGGGSWGSRDDRAAGAVGLVGRYGTRLERGEGVVPRTGRLRDVAAIAPTSGAGGRIRRRGRVRGLEGRLARGRRRARGQRRRRLGLLAETWRWRKGHDERSARADTTGDKM